MYNTFPPAPPPCYPELRDYGPEPFVINIEEATIRNTNFRTALWTGCYLQLTLMSINVGSDIGLEMHPFTDQFIRIEQGQGVVRMGSCPNNLVFQRQVAEDDVILIPAGTWHNLINTGEQPLKLYSIYAPPEHPRGTVHVTRPEEHHAY
ncbi:MAG TPA: cupin domain-containing protein [Firmicutes bacterium]|jgi:mannose-6-phosphate isomerase-like protein (cupin superfamily)|nr:cupin domain-containing protein [Bacillota bacterium]